MCVKQILHFPDKLSSSLPNFHLLYQTIFFLYALYFIPLVLLVIKKLNIINAKEFPLGYLKVFNFQKVNFFVPNRHCSMIWDVHSGLCCIGGLMFPATLVVQAGQDDLAQALPTANELQLRLTKLMILLLFDDLVTETITRVQVRALPLSYNVS